MRRVRTQFAILVGGDISQSSDSDFLQIGEQELNDKSNAAIFTITNIIKVSELLFKSIYFQTDLLNFEVQIRHSDRDSVPIAT